MNKTDEMMNGLGPLYRSNLGSTIPELQEWSNLICYQLYHPINVCGAGHIDLYQK